MNKLINLIRFAVRDPRAIYYYAQKGVRNYGVRKRLASSIARVRKTSPASSLSQKSSKWLDALGADGYLLLPETLSSDQLAEIHEYLAALPCVDLANPELGEFNLNKDPSPKTRIARYKSEDILNCPHLLATANNSDLLATVRQYLGCEPTMTLFEAWWSIPNDDTQSGTAESYQDYQFHRDVEDFKFLKLFVYLSDVSESSGPHIFIAGSHDDGRLTQRSSLEASAITRAFGPEAQVAFTGSAGLGILEDTFGIHRAMPPISERRLILSVTYCLTGLSPFSPQHPPGELPLGMTPYVNRLFCSSPR